MRFLRTTAAAPGYRSFPRVARAGRQSLLHRLRRLLFRHRRLLAALLLSAAAALSVEQLTPAPLKLVGVLVAARELPAGATISASDVLVGSLPLSGVPPGALTAPDKAIGQQLAAPLHRHQPLVDVSLIGPTLLSGTSPGTSAVPVRLSDPATADLVRPGQRVSIVLSSTAGLNDAVHNQLLAAGVAVLWKAKTAESGQGLLGGGSSANDGLLVVAASPPQAQLLAGASARGKVFLVLESAAPP